MYLNSDSISQVFFQLYSINADSLLFNQNLFRVSGDISPKEPLGYADFYNRGISINEIYETKK